MNDTLALIGTLQKYLSDNKTTLSDADEIWSVLEKVEASFALYQLHVLSERQSIEQLRDGVSEGIATMRKGLQPDFNRARRALMSLKHSVEERTIGTDGWPLRHG